ncbi:aldo/keto reductase [Amycolatopsis sp. CA-126428]|uniref:aldo/keto reductase n=1 Tax=Amycolatopsis sp. CA-126428 TaxID=2073158 RepID=UPI000CD17D6B|nr:aldo/keto reductase [Amycolatopsis sp. CA-126428]
MQTLPRRFLSGLGAEVSAVGAGCWTIGGPATNNGVPIGWDHVDTDAAYAGLLHAHERGVTLYDTADVYGLGQSERLLGRLLRLIDRTAVHVASKVGYFAGTARHAYQPAQMRRQLATTLDNLGTDYLDIYYLHSTDFGPDDQYLPGVVETMTELRREGLIRTVGMRAPHVFAEHWADSDHPHAAQTARFLHLFHTIRPDVITARYNLLSPLYADTDTDVFALARRHGVGVVIKQALGQGLLLKPHAGALPPFSAADHRSRDPEFHPAALELLRQRLSPIRARFGNRPADLARIALGYALHHAPDAPVLVGFRNADQIHTTLTAAGDPLTPEEFTEIRAALHPTPANRKA